MAKAASTNTVRSVGALALGALCVILVVSNVLWLGKVKAERRVAELEDKLQENNKLVKEMKTKISSASTQQEAEHDRAASLQERVTTLEAQLMAAQSGPKNILPSLKPLPPPQTTTTLPPNPPRPSLLPPPPAVPRPSLPLLLLSRLPTLCSLCKSAAEEEEEEEQKREGGSR